MNRPKKTSITRGITYTFAILLVLYGLHTLLAGRAIHTISGLARTIHNHPLVVSNASLQATISIVKMHRGMKDIVLLRDPSGIHSTLAAINSDEAEAIRQLRIVQENILGGEGQRIVSDTLSLFMQWSPIRTKVIALVEQGQREAAAQVTLTDGAAHVARLEEQMLQLTNYARTKASGFLAETESVYAGIRTWSILLFSLWGLLFVAIACFTISRTRRGERDLADEKEKLDVTLRSIGDGVIATDHQGKVTLLNEVAETLTGWTEADACGRNIETVFRIVNEATRIPCENPIAKVIETGTVVGLANHTILIARDGTERAIADSGAPIWDEDRKIIGVVLVFRDQTEERYYQNEIARNETKYRLLSENTLDIIWTMDLDLCFTYINSAVNTFTGHTQKEWIGSHLSEHCDAWNTTLFEEHIRRELANGATGAGILFETEMLTKAGETKPVEIRGKVIYDQQHRPIGLQGVTRDISERKAAERRRDSLERQLVQAQKMESVGRLAGGVAHDFNNMLNVIMGYSEMLLEEADPSLHGDIKEILAAAQRSAQITRQLLAFARKQTIAPMVLDLNSTIGDLLKMIGRLIGEDIDLAWLPDRDLYSVKIDPTQVDQILANLCVNSRDAIAGVGKITIETKNVSFDDEYCRDHAGFLPGDYVLLAVSDDGGGMDKAIQENIFEPFFTTKGVGKGTGLGLATVYGIVKQNEGFVNVYSEPGKGTTIKVYLPRFAGEKEEARLTTATNIPHGKGETILLVEDEVAILKLGKRMLEQLGYRVIDANSPEKAVGLAESHSGSIDLLITDVVMPGMNGRDLAHRIQAMQGNGVRVLYMSGYTANVIAHRGVLDDGVCFMPKPFSQKALANSVREALER